MFSEKSSGRKNLQRYSLLDPCPVQMLMWGSLKNEPLWAIIVIKLSHLLLTVSSAVNILIYSYKV
jgi:hypothetical protein